MLVISIIYPCNFGCPNCPYTDANSDIRQFYHEHHGDLFPVPLWNKLAVECGKYGAWMRCTGGGEPMLHPHMVDMIELAKASGARIWMNTNGSMFGPTPALRQKLERVIKAGIRASDAAPMSATISCSERCAGMRMSRFGVAIIAPGSSSMRPSRRR